MPPWLWLVVTRTVQSKASWLHFSHTFQLIGIKFDKVLKPFKLNIPIPFLWVRFNEASYKGSNCCVTECVQKPFNIGLHSDAHVVTGIDYLLFHQFFFFDVHSLLYHTTILGPDFLYLGCFENWKGSSAWGLFTKTVAQKVIPYWSHRDCLCHQSCKFCESVGLSWLACSHARVRLNHHSGATCFRASSWNQQTHWFAWLRIICPVIIMSTSLMHRWT